MLVLVDAAAFSGPVRLAIGGDEAGDLFGHAARAHIGVESVGGLADDDARLLERLADGADFGRIAVQHAGAGLDRRQRSVAQIGAGAKLLDQHDDPALRVVEQHRRRFAMAIDVVVERARRAVVLLDLDLGAGQIEPPGGENSVADHACGFGHRLA